MKRNILLAALCALFMLPLCAQEPVFVDASTLTIIGKPFPTKSPFRRIEGFDFEQKVLNRRAKCSTGVGVLFKTDSRRIDARWVTGPNLGSNMNPIGMKGLDLYIKDGKGQWRFAGAGQPVMKEDYCHHERKLVDNMAPGEKECLLYLPLYTYCDSLLLGIDEGAKIEPLDNPFKHRVLFGGSSITQGASASRPGLCYTGLLATRYGIYAMNYGFSGNFKLQPKLAEYAAKVDVDAFVFDAFSNPSAAEIEERFDAFMDIIRAAHPTTPVILLQTERRESCNFNQVIEAEEAAKQAMAVKVAKRRMKKDKNLYFIDSKKFLTPDGNATVDGVHPTDIGFYNVVDALYPVLKRVLK